MNINLEDQISKYLTQVAEQSPLNIPEALFRTSMLRLTLTLLGSFITDLDDSLKQLEDGFRMLLDKEETNDRLH
jgi:hypothetical protein